MKRAFIAILSFILLLPIYHASEISTLEADGDVGYRQVDLIWSTDSPTQEGTIFQIWMSNETIIETINATITKIYNLLKIIFFQYFQSQLNV